VCFVKYFSRGVSAGLPVEIN